MENIIEVIFTLIFGFFWLFGSTLFKRRENDESEQPTPPRRSRKSEDDQESTDYESRQQDIREMIRRKIAERRQQSDSDSPVVVAEPETQSRRQYESIERLRETEAPADPVQSPKKAVEETFSWNVKNNPYEQEMQERLKAIEATRRKAEALKKEVKEVKRDQHDSSQEESTSGESVLLFGSVQSALKNPRTVRAAFIYSEILGKPIGLRASSDNGFGV